MITDPDGGLSRRGMLFGSWSMLLLYLWSFGLLGSLYSVSAMWVYWILHDGVIGQTRKSIVHCLPLCVYKCAREFTKRCLCFSCFIFYRWKEVKWVNRSSWRLACSVIEGLARFVYLAYPDLVKAHGTCFNVEWCFLNVIVGSFVMEVLKWLFLVKNSN